jgi:hypothetical protein
MRPVRHLFLRGQLVFLCGAERIDVPKTESWGERIVPELCAVCLDLVPRKRRRWWRWFLGFETMCSRRQHR